MLHCCWASRPNHQVIIFFLLLVDAYDCLRSFKAAGIVFHLDEMRCLGFLSVRQAMKHGSLLVDTIAGDNVGRLSVLSLL